MFKKFTNGCVRVVNRWLPDAFLFAVILTIVTFVGSMIGTKQTPLELVDAWGNSKGFWGLLSFSMQMALVLVFGSAMAIAWGDQWTNMVQPFWALPILGMAGLSARNIMGYLVIVTLFTGVVACLGFLGWAMFF